MTCEQKGTMYTMNQENNNGIVEIDLLKLLKALWRQIWLVILAMLVAGGIAFTYAQYMVTPLYKAGAMLYVNNASLSVGGTKVSISSADLSASQSLVDTYLVILNTRGTLNEVIQEAGLDCSYETLKGMIEATAVDSTEVFRVEVTSSDPAQAELIANTVARVLPERIADIVEGTSAKVVDYAVTPSSRYFPSLTRYTAIGILIGAVLSCGYIALRELLDDQIRSEKDLGEHYLQIPVLAAIPDMTNDDSEHYTYDTYRGYGKQKYEKKDAAQGKQQDRQKEQADTSKRGAMLCFGMSFAAQEAYKLLRTNLMFSMPDDCDCRTFGVTSALRGDGKSTTTLNLCYSLAEAGKKVLLVEADLRLPTLSRRLNLPKTPGLSNLLINLAEKDKAIRPSGLLDTMDVLTAGDVPPNPSELLGSEQMKKFLQEMEQRYDYVILDLPPVNAVADGLVISKLVQGMVMVVRQDYDDFRSVDDALRRMEYLQCKVLGMVLNCAGLRGGRYGYRYKRYGKYGGYKRYGYRYGGGYKNYSYSYANYGYGHTSTRGDRKKFREAVVSRDGEGKAAKNNKA